MRRQERILDAQYEQPHLQKEVANYTHLTELERAQLLALLMTHESLFNGQLGTWKGRPVDIKLKPEAAPYHAKAYKIPHIYEKPSRKNSNDYRI